MGRILRALIATFLLTEITAVFVLVGIWALLSEFHASISFIIGAEAVAALGLLALAVAIFRRALAAETALALEAAEPSPPV
jgi:hypothetical protein